jgi:hypothetical protein
MVGRVKKNIYERMGKKGRGLIWRIICGRLLKERKKPKNPSVTIADRLTLGRYLNRIPPVYKKG